MAIKSDMICLTALTNAKLHKKLKRPRVKLCFSFSVLVFLNLIAGKISNRRGCGGYHSPPVTSPSISISNCSGEVLMV